MNPYLIHPDKLRDTGAFALGVTVSCAVMAFVALAKGPEPKPEDTSAGTLAEAFELEQSKADDLARRYLEASHQHKEDLEYIKELEMLLESAYETRWECQKQLDTIRCDKREVKRQAREMECIRSVPDAHIPKCKHWVGKAEWCG